MKFGYSGKELIIKLGYKPAEQVCVVEAPDLFMDYLRQQKIIITGRLPATWCHAFFTSQAELEAWLTQTKLEDIEKALWVSWPKRSSKVLTDLTEQIFRDKILPLGWVDTKVAAIDGAWSGLKFLRRKA